MGMWAVDFMIEGATETLVHVVAGVLSVAFYLLLWSMFGLAL